MTKKKILLFGVVSIIVILLVFAFIARKFGIWDNREKKIITSSTLTEAIDISELSSAQFVYNGIAEIYKDEEKTETKCHVRYNATVKAGIDMKAVTFEINHEAKTIKPVLPEINITSNTVDEKTFSYIPENSDVNLQEVLVACQEDALAESKQSSELLDLAKENLKSFIEALLLPIASSQNYKIIWD